MVVGDRSRKTWMESDLRLVSCGGTERTRPNEGDIFEEVRLSVVVLLEKTESPMTMTDLGQPGQVVVRDLLLPGEQHPQLRQRRAQGGEAGPRGEDGAADLMEVWTEGAVVATNAI